MSNNSKICRMLSYTPARFIKNNVVQCCMNDTSSITDVQVKESNRIYLPKNIRDKLKLKIGDWITIIIKKNGLIENTKEVKK